MGDDFDNDGVGPFPEDMKAIKWALIALVTLFGALILIEVMT